jgi:hypothetical protein
MQIRFIFNLDEKEAADTLGLTIDTIRTWRSNGTLPDYLYRRFGTPSQYRIRYCLHLLLRWQSVCSDEIDRQQEEVWARSELIRSLEVKKK